MYDALTIFGSLAGLVALGISLYGYIRSSHHRDVINRNAGLLQTTMANAIEHMEISNHNEDLIKQTCELLLQMIKNTDTKVASEARDNTKDFGRLGTSFLDLREQLQASNEAQGDVNTATRNLFDVLERRTSELVDKVDSLEQVEDAMNADLNDFMPRVYSGEMPVLDAEFTDHAADALRYAMEYVGKFETKLPPIEVRELVGCGATNEFYIGCSSCMKANGIDASVVNDRIHRDDIKDYRYLQFVYESSEDYKQRIGEQLLADKAKPTLPASLIPEGAVLTHDGKGGINYYYPTRAMAEDAMRTLASVQPALRGEAAKLAADILNRGYTKPHRGPVEQRERAQRAIGDITGWDTSDPEMTKLQDGVLGSGDNQVPRS